MGLLGKYNLFARSKVWVIAIVAVLGVVIKLFHDKSDRLEEDLRRADEKVEAARAFRENSKKVKRMDISDIDTDIRRMFPPSGDSTDSTD